MFGLYICDKNLTDTLSLKFVTNILSQNYVTEKLQTFVAQMYNKNILSQNDVTEKSLTKICYRNL